MVEMNWARTHTYAATAVHRPATLDEARRIIAGSANIRVLGTRHAFNDMADSSELISLDGVADADGTIVDKSRSTVTCSASMTYGALAEALHPHGLAVHNLASLPHISIGGAIATGTHGSGDRLGNLATSVAALRLIRSDGDVVDVARGDADLAGVVVGLGALGAVTRVTLDVEPSFDIAQRVYEGLSWEALEEHFDEIMGSGDSVSVFSRWGDRVEQVWVKERAESDLAIGAPLFDAAAATGERHPIVGVDPVHCTPQLGRRGRWSDRLPHFRMGFTPSSGEEIQSELLLPREHAAAVIRTMRSIGGDVADHLLVSEIRTVAADDGWMSPQQGRATMALHFTWKPEPSIVAGLVARIEDLLEPYEPRPHWGKVFAMDSTTIRTRYPRADAFAGLVDRFDPRGAFRNAWLDRTLLG